MVNTTNLLEVRGLFKKYKTFTLKDVSFDVPKGYITGFIGPNGAGKTTSIKAILGIISAEAGTVKMFGKEHSNVLNTGIGVVMDSPMYVDDWTVSDVEKAIAPFYGNWDSGKYAGYINQFGLDKKKKVKDLSRGMKMKLQIATALSHDAQLLILDEPTSGLDPVARDEICDILREFVSDENRSAFFSTHITSDLEKTADYIIFILEGKIVYSGSKDELIEKYARAAGSISDISSEHKKLIIGYRGHSTGFEGMVETANIRKLPKSVLTEDISLEEIIIFMNREGKESE
ncbi:MAG: ABC transporter ATP-binding protein [Oscillospiraceae bacterium]|jgi:ABC-2 type transport system ATP-binding protein|nr:ABC transporter ATP-binding protein [Oscillospiraceae bacterium]